MKEKTPDEIATSGEFVEFTMDALALPIVQVLIV